MAGALPPAWLPIGPRRRRGVEALLAACGVALPGPGAAGRHPDLEWARSGAMALSGLPGGPPLLAPAPLATRAREVGEALRALSGSEALAQLDAAALLGERAALFDAGAPGRALAGRELPPARGGRRLAGPEPGPPRRRGAAAGLARGGRCVGPVGLCGGARRARVGRCARRARPAAGPAAGAGFGPAPGVATLGAHRRARPARARGASQLPLVVDLSALWGGPLCTHLLQLAGARVVKVESTRRPDGARFGPAAFLDLLNAGKQSVALDFASPEGRARLRRCWSAPTSWWRARGRARWPSWASRRRSWFERFRASPG